ncbi:MAG: hypothetical protein Fur0037_13320 [Planctomycetota bacterium]
MARRSPKRSLHRAVMQPLGLMVLVVLAAIGTMAWYLFPGHGETVLQLVGACLVLALGQILLISLLLRRIVQKPLTELLRTLDLCSIEGKAMRLSDHATLEFQNAATVLNGTLDRMVRNEAKLKAVIHAAPDAIVTSNHRGIIQSFNPAAERMFGIKASSAIGRNVSILMPQPNSRRHDEYVRRHLESGVSRVLDFAREETGLRSDGKTFPISLTVTKVYLGDEPPLFCAVIRDITEEKAAARAIMRHASEMELTSSRLASAMTQAEQATAAAKAANESKSAFLANMSHEIRTPMTAILGYAENLRDHDLSTRESKAAIETILRNGDHLMSLINDILDLSKIEAGKLTVEKIECSPVEISSEAAALMRVRAEAKGISLDTEFSGPIPEKVTSDPTRLRQILINLLGNAIKFTEKGRVLMRVSMAGDGKLCFEIEDTGIGMDPARLEELFRPFEQADSSTARRFGGTGLGLCISKKLACLLGGDIVATSEEGKGSRFTVSIDPGDLADVAMREQPREAPPRPKRRREEPPAARIRKRLLLVEDGADNQRLIAFILRKAGATVALVDDGKQAVEMALDAEASGKPFDLVLMDMQMPVMDGYEAAASLRRAGFTKPIVALTANAMSGDEAKCLEAGCTAFATKPVDRRALLAKLAELLGETPEN